jgi:hypothetical protein
MVIKVNPLLTIDVLTCMDDFIIPSNITKTIPENNFSFHVELVNTYRAIVALG